MKETLSIHEQKAQRLFKKKEKKRKREQKGKKKKKRKKKSGWAGWWWWRYSGRTPKKLSTRIEAYKTH